MRDKLGRFLVAMGSVLEVKPARKSRLAVRDPQERLRRPWARTGQALQRSMDKFAREQASQ